MSRGGARPNSGRKSRGETISFALKIRKPYAERLREMAKEQEVTIGEVFEQIMRHPQTRA